MPGGDASAQANISLQNLVTLGAQNFTSLRPVLMKFSISVESGMILIY